MADDADAPHPECFGRLEKVFPRGADGLRHSPAECLACADKTACLRAAVSGEQGVAVHEERIERSWRSGSTGFLARWAQQKALHGRRRREGILARLSRLLKADRGSRDA
jgi:hypothetical protein